jgi:chemotaxis protein CheD
VGAVFLHPGEWVAAAEPTEVTTILGSCVSVCLWDVGGAAGGMNHFLLPGEGTPGLGAGRFADTALPALLDEVLRLGGRMGSLRAHVAGGACMTAALSAADHLGLRNAAAARAFLAASGIPVARDATGGVHGFRIRFRIDTGAVSVRRTGP